MNGSSTTGLSGDEMRAYAAVGTGAARVCAGEPATGGHTYGEIKRMYVAPEARRQGLARILLQALEDAARGLGYTVARLDTGSRQPHAERLYASQGYRAIGNFNDNPVAHYFGEKRL